MPCSNSFVVVCFVCRRLLTAVWPSAVQEEGKFLVAREREGEPLSALVVWRFGRMSVEGCYPFRETRARTASYCGVVPFRGRERCRAGRPGSSANGFCPTERYPCSMLRFVVRA